MIFCQCPGSPKQLLSFSLCLDWCSPDLSARQEMLENCTLHKWKARFYWSSSGNLTDKPPGLGLQRRKSSALEQKSQFNVLIGTHVSLGMEGDYEAPFAAVLLKWRNRAMVMDTFFCSQMFSVKVLINYPWFYFVQMCHFTQRSSTFSFPKICNIFWR